MVQLLDHAKNCRLIVNRCYLTILRQPLIKLISDLKGNLKDNHDFFSKYETNLHTYAVETESKLMADKFLLERLLKMQEHRNVGGEKCDERLKEDKQKEACRALVTNVTACEKCVTPIYDSVNMIYTCIRKYAFDVTKVTRQVRCDFTNGQAELVVVDNEKNDKFSGELICRPMSEDRMNPCPYTCSQTGQCYGNSENELVCGCLRGFRDLSGQHGKIAGSICSQCNNTKTHGTDYVILFDISDSIKPEAADKMYDFLNEFLKFIDIDHSNNRFSLIVFGAEAKQIFSLEPKTSTSEIIKFMRNKDEIGKLKSLIAQEAGTNTPRALKAANYVYALNNSTNSRVTILFTDGGPNNCYSDYKKIYWEEHQDECIIKDLIKGVK